MSSEHEQTTKLICFLPCLCLDLSVIYFLCWMTILSSYLHVPKPEQAVWSVLIGQFSGYITHRHFNKLALRHCHTWGPCSFLLFIVWEWGPVWSREFSMSPAVAASPRSSSLTFSPHTAELSTAQNNIRRGKKREQCPVYLHLGNWSN